MKSTALCKLNNPPASSPFRASVNYVMLTMLAMLSSRGLCINNRHLPTLWAASDLPNNSQLQINHISDIFFHFFFPPQNKSSSLPELAWPLCKRNTSDSINFQETTLERAAFALQLLLMF